MATSPPSDGPAAPEAAPAASFNFPITLGALQFVPRVLEGGRVLWEYTVHARDYNPHGVLHGGVLLALLDTAMGFTIANLVVPKGRFNAVAEMSTRFLAPVRSGVVRAEATVVKLGKRLAVVDARAEDDSGTLVATASATHAVLP